jgi:multiple sugar transport system permease protein
MTEGGPGQSTRVLLLVTDTAFTDYRVGAASVLLFIVILLVTVIRQVGPARPGTEGGLT